MAAAGAATAAAAAAARRRAPSCTLALLVLLLVLVIQPAAGLFGFRKKAPDEATAKAALEESMAADAARQKGKVVAPKKQKPVAGVSARKVRAGVKRMYLGGRDRGCLLLAGRR